MGKMLARLKDRHRLIIETCIATGARVSEVLGLRWKHLDLKSGTIKIEQRVWHQEAGPPRTELSRRVLCIGGLVESYFEKAPNDGSKAENWIFPQKRDKTSQAGPCTADNEINSPSRRPLG